VRYLKRWKHVNFVSPAPHSIALTGAAYYWFTPNADVFLEDLDDRSAVLGLVRRLLDEFRDGRLTVALPVPPSTDLLERMTPAQMLELRTKLEALEAALNLAGEQETEAAVNTLASQFGADFN